MGLTASDLSLVLRERTILDNISVTLPQGVVTGIIGPNGAGKSSLLRVLVGLTSTHGSVHLDGQVLPPTGTKARARRIGYLPQAHEVHWPLTVRRTVGLGLLPKLGDWQRPGPAEDRAVEAALRRVAMLGHADRRVDTLSGGERARVMLARVLVTETPVVLADEPVAALDPAHQISVMGLLRRQAKEADRAVAVVLHDLTLAARYCDRLLLLDAGRVIEAGDVSAVLASPSLERVYGISFARTTIRGCPVLTPLDPPQEREP